MVVTSNCGESEVLRIERKVDRMDGQVIGGIISVLGLHLELPKTRDCITPSVILD